MSAKILVIPGSLRTGSLNAKLAATIAAELAQAGAEVTRISLGDFPLPIYDGDLQAKSGVPKPAINLKRMMSSHHGVLIVTPEHNASIPSLLKNAIDWVSRIQDPHEARGEVFRDRAFAIASASGGRLGGAGVPHATAPLRSTADDPPAPGRPGGCGEVAPASNRRRRRRHGRRCDRRESAHRRWRGARARDVAYGYW